MTLTIEEAIKMAIEYEVRVRDVYKIADNQATDPLGKRVFGVLAKEEQDHVDFLSAKLKEWRKTGTVTAQRLTTAVPSRTKIEDGISALTKKVPKPSKRDTQREVELLKRALEVEVETGRFYNQMIKELPPAGQALFTPFTEIEEGHRTIVQAEIDFVTGTGYWFDFRETDLPSGRT